jgi:uncharacterized protein YacL
MIRKVVRGIITLLFATAGLYLAYLLLEANISLSLLSWTNSQKPYFYVGNGIIAAGIGFLLAPWIMNLSLKVTRWFEARLHKMPTNDLVGGAIGLIIGLLISTLFSSVLSQVPLFGPFLSILLSLFLGYLGISLGTKRKDDIFSVFTILPRFGKDKGNKAEPKGAAFKILDTSVIIDGRIADIIKSGFIEGILLIPGFVLEELRHIADSSDLLKRNRGRRGLDILNQISKESDIKVQIYEQDFDDIAEVDSKLVRLAQVLGAQVLTNDYNLNKVAELQGVKVLNINELANAVKPVVLPGEEMVVQVIKDGKEVGQGVAYLDDGTMIVVDGGKKFIGQTIGILVTSVLQTAAGRMIFAKPKSVEKKGLAPHQLNEVNMIG